MQTRPQLGTLVMALCLVAADGVLADDAEQRRTVSVTGRGEVRVPPDQAIISFAVETTAPTAGEAVESNARTSATVATAIKDRLTDTDKVMTTRYSLDPFYEPRERGSRKAPKIAGYVARNEVRVTTRQIDQVGKFIDTATAAGANRVSGLQFAIEDRGPQLRKALEKAGMEARQQAESVATALGVRLKHVVAATSSSSPITLPRRRDMFAMAAAESRAPTPLEPGEVTVGATLQVTYEIE